MDNEVFNTLDLKNNTFKANKKLKFRIDLVEKLSLNWQWSQQGYDWLQIVPDQPRGTKVQWITEVG